VVTSYEGELILKAAAHGGSGGHVTAAAEAGGALALPGAARRDAMVDDGQKIAKDGVLFTLGSVHQPDHDGRRGAGAVRRHRRRETVREERTKSPAGASA